MEIKIDSIRNDNISIEIMFTTVAQCVFATVFEKSYPEEKESIIKKYSKIVESIVKSFAFEHNSPQVREMMKSLIENAVINEVNKDIRDYKIRYILDGQKNSK